MTIFLKGLLCALGIFSTGGAVAGGYFFKDYSKSKNNHENSDQTKSQPSANSTQTDPQQGP